MKLKTIALAVLLAANGAAHAAPTMQTCAPMEITHNGNSGLSYSLACDAGGWSLKYTGAVPAGTDSVQARYRVQVSNPDGAKFTHNRSVRLPAPNFLGQALAREAVLLDNGDLALRDCPEFSCTLYRPLGNAEKLAKATITTTPEIKRLADEAIRLTAELTKRQAELDAQTGKVAALQLEVSTLTTKLGGAEHTLANAKSALESAKQQHTADLDGLLTSSKSEIASAAAAATAQSGAEIAKLNGQLASVSKALDAARKELSDCSAAHGVAEEAKAKADAEVQARGKQVVELQASLRAAEAELKRVLDCYDAKVADLTGKQAQASAGATADVAAVRLKLDASSREVERLLTRVAALEQTLEQANKQLAAAQATQSGHATALTDAADNQDRLRAVLEIALAEAQITIAELTTARSAQVVELQASLADATQKLSSAEAQLSELAARPAPTEGSQAELAAATARIDELVTKVAGLEVALEFANYNVDDAQRAQRGAEAAYADMAAAYEQNLQQLSALTGELAQARAVTTGTADVQLVNAALEKTTVARDEALTEVARLTAAMGALIPQVETLEAERLAALKGSQQVANEMLQALDYMQDLQAAKDDAEKALTSTSNRLLEQTAKLEAANLARELAMQAATTAHADADAQNLRNQELAAQLTQAIEIGSSQRQRIEELEAANANHVAELAALRQQLAQANGAHGDVGKSQPAPELDKAH